MKTTNELWLSMTEEEKRKAHIQRALYLGRCQNYETNKNNAK